MINESDRVFIEIELTMTLLSLRYLRGGGGEEAVKVV